MALSNPSSPGRDKDYEAFVNEQRKARRLLARMDRTEDFARQWEEFDQINTHLAAWELDWHRQHHANTYRRLVGVMPDQREALRQELQEIMRTGNGTVDTLVATVRGRTSAILAEQDPK